MGDIADILGISHGAAGRSAGSSSASMGEEAVKIMHASQAGSANDFKRKKKPKGMKREVFDLLGADTLVSSIQGNSMAPNFKNKRLNLLRGKWLWTPIHNSARACNDAVFFHWCKADLNNSDYPYAKFNVKLDDLAYSDAEYTSLLTDPQWTKTVTDQLISCCHKYDLRWPVVHDRMMLSCPSPPRSLEDMQSRYYFVRAVLRKYRSMATSQEAIGSSSSSSAVHSATVDSCLKSISIGFDMELERKRRRVHDFMFRRTKQDEMEEAQLREDLKAVEAALKKTKKSRATTTTSSEAAAPSTKRKVEKATTAAAVAQKPTRSILFALDTKPPSTAVGQSSSSSSSSGAVVEIGPARGRPCLQSSRLYSTSYMPLAIESGSHIGTSNANPALSKRLVEKMNSYLRELEIPENPLPTRAVCDLVEAVKRKTVTLMSLHNTITKTRRDHERAKTQSQEVVTVVKSAGSSSRGGSQRPKQSSNTATAGARKESKSSKKANQGVLEVQSITMLPSESLTAV